MKVGLKPRFQFRCRGVAGNVAIESPGHQDHLRGRKGPQLILHGLDHVLVTHPGGRRDASLGQRGGT